MVDGYIPIEGYAYPDGERGAQVVNVQLSFDDGRTWKEVHELQMETKKNADAKVFSWTLWRYRLKVVDALEIVRDGSIKVRVRAVDSEGETQTADIKDLYNVRGLLNNSPHSISFKLKL